MLNINECQKRLLLEYLPDSQQYIDNDDIGSLLLDLDDKLTEVGFKADYELNGVGHKLQKLYDQIYMQNK